MSRLNQAIEQRLEWIADQLNVDISDLSEPFENLLQRLRVALPRVTHSNRNIHHLEIEIEEIELEFNELADETETAEL